MKFVEYDDVDPLKVLHVTQLALDFAFALRSVVAKLRQIDRTARCRAVAQPSVIS